MRSLKQLALLAFVKSVETSNVYRVAGETRGYLAVSLPDDELQQACIALLARRGRLTSSALRPLLGSLSQADLSRASPSLDLARTINRAPLLSRLALRGRLTDALAARLPRLPHLKALDASCNPRLTDAGLAVVVALVPSLAWLSLAYCSRLTSLESIASLETLSSLDARQLPRLRVLPSKWPSGLATLLLCGSREVEGQLPSGLRWLELGECPRMGAGQLPSGLRGLVGRGGAESWAGRRGPDLPQHLRTLDLSESEVEELEACADLHTLVLERCPRLRRLAGSWPRLTGLSLAGSPLEQLPELPRLTALSLAHWPLLSDHQAAQLILQFPLLLRLDLSWCPQLSDSLLPLLPSHLTLLRLYGCPLFSLTALEAHQRQHPQLVLLATRSP